ncbi:MAG: hypothetical protein QOD84_590 [Acidobacteriaceae bacterium]
MRDHWHESRDDDCRGSARWDCGFRHNFADAYSGGWLRGNRYLGWENGRLDLEPLHNHRRGCCGLRSCPCTFVCVLIDFSACDRILSGVFYLFLRGEVSAITGVAEFSGADTASNPPAADTNESSRIWSIRNSDQSRARFLIQIGVPINPKARRI